MSKQRNSNRRPRSPVSPVLMMVDSKAALEASQRLYDSCRSGLRFSCEHREVMSAEEALARDRQEARRKGKRAEREAADDEAGEAPGSQRAHSEEDSPSAWLDRSDRRVDDPVDDDPDIDEFDADDTASLDLAAYEDDAFDEAEVDELAELGVLEAA